MMNTVTYNSKQQSGIISKIVFRDSHPNVNLEDNPLIIFRVLMLLRLLAVLALFLIIPRNVDGQLLSRMLNIVEISLILIYLNLSFLETIMGKAYLPAALIWTSVVPLIVQNISLYIIVQRLPQTANALDIPFIPAYALEHAMVISNIGQTFPVLMIPLIILSWYYSRRLVLIFCAATTFFDALAIFFFVPLSSTAVSVAMIFIVFRSFVYVLIGIMVNYLVSIQRKQQQELVAANEKLRHYATVREQLAVTQERNRLARELHDTLAHTLAAATVHLEAVRVIRDTQPKRAQNMVDQAVLMMRDGLAETRRALQALRAEPIDRLNLADSFTVLAESINSRYPITVDVNAPEKIVGLDATTHHAVYRITQESLFNCVKHAQASKIQLYVNQTEDKLSVRIVDNGVGFDTQAVDITQRFGIQGMRERAQSIGATLQLVSQLGQGTTVKIEVRS